MFYLYAFNLKTIQQLAMKKLFFFACLLSGFYSHAQFTGGGVTDPSSMDSKKGHTEKSVFRKGYLRLGLNAPMGHFSANPDLAMPLYKNVAQSGGMGASAGAVLEVGHYYYFNKEDEGPVKYGLDWTIVSVSYNPLSWGEEVESVDATAAYFFGISSKLGPVVSYSFAEKGLLSVYAKVAPTVMLGNVDYGYSTDDRNEEFLIDGEAAFGVKANFGVTIGYGAGSLSLDFDAGSTKMSYYYNNGDISGNNKEKMPASSLQLKLGLRF